MSKTIFITGASSGLGKASALLFAKKVEMYKQRNEADEEAF